MAALKPIVAVLALCVALPAAAAAQDISGDWEVTIESPQGQATIDAVFKQVGEAVTGSVTSPMGSVDFTGKLVNTALSVAYKLDVQGNVLDITMNGTVLGDTMNGTIVITDMGEIPWTAKRKVAGATPTPVAETAVAPAAAAEASAATAAAAAAGDASGKWDITLNVGGQGELPMTATFTQDGDKITGTLSSALGDTPVAGTMIGNALKLDFVAQTPQGDIPVVWTGELGPNGFAGKASMPGLGEADWTGKKAAVQ